MENIKICANCGCVIENEKFLEVDGKFYCEDCFAVCAGCGCVELIDNEMAYIDGEYYCSDCYTVCEHCGGKVLSDDIHAVMRDGDETFVCSSCMDAYYVVCDCCGDIVYSRNCESSHGHYLCRSCEDNGYHICADCGEISEYCTYDDDTDQWFCEDCAASRGAIHNYSYDPDWEYLGGEHYKYDGIPRYGVEVEIDDDDEGQYHNASKCAGEIQNVEPYIYCKHDGSLGEYGIELVTFPATLDYHLNEFHWDDICNIAKYHDYSSHNTETCGMHIHVGREALSKDCDARIIAIVDRIWDDVCRFSRRDDSHWAKRPNTEINENDPDDAAVWKAKSSCDGDRYMAINIGSKANTIEMRTFRGTLLPSTIRASIVFFDCIVRYADTHSIKQCSTVQFKDIAAMTDNAEFHAYCASRHINY